MIYAHIKSTFGDRDEEWQDSRVPPDQQHLVIDFQAYVTGIADNNGKEYIQIVPKFYWEIFEEMQAFVLDQPGDYPGITAYAQQTLKRIGGYFQRYLDIEKLFMGQGSVAPERYDELKQDKDNIEMQNDMCYEDLLVLAVPITQGEQSGETQQALRPMLLTMYDFTILFGDSLKALEIMLTGLRTRAAGGNYTPLNFVNDLAEFKRVAEVRRDEEHQLTAARNTFNAFVRDQSIKT